MKHSGLETLRSFFIFLRQCLGVTLFFTKLGLGLVLCILLYRLMLLPGCSVSLFTSGFMQDTEGMWEFQSVTAVTHNAERIQVETVVLAVVEVD